MPTETLKPVVNGAGQFERPLQAAYEQWDLTAGKVIAEFPIWQLMMVRIRPDNYDNWGSLGRPYLDATRAVWRQLTMTERDLIVRRSEEHTSELQSLMRISYAVFCLKKHKARNSHTMTYTPQTHTRQ